MPGKIQKNTAAGQRTAAPRPSAITLVIKQRQIYLLSSLVLLHRILTRTRWGVAQCSKGQKCF